MLSSLLDAAFAHPPCLPQSLVMLYILAMAWLLWLFWTRWPQLSHPQAALLFSLSLQQCVGKHSLKSGPKINIVTLEAFGVSRCSPWLRKVAAIGGQCMAVGGVHLCASSV